jgi:hypothetical protein
MTTAGNVLALLGAVLALLGALINSYGLRRVWHRTAPPSIPGPTQYIRPAGIPPGESFGASTVTADNPQPAARTGGRKLAEKAKRWMRLGRPIHHTGNANLEGTATGTAGGDVIRQMIDALGEQNASARAEDRRHNAESIKQAINDYGATERANTRKQTRIAAIGLAMNFFGLAMTIAGITLRILVG